jgi:hypothetical protein
MIVMIQRTNDGDDIWGSNRALLHAGTSPTYLPEGGGRFLFLTGFFLRVPVAHEQHTR